MTEHLSKNEETNAHFKNILINPFLPCIYHNILSTNTSIILNPQSRELCDNIFNITKEHGISPVIKKYINHDISGVQLKQIIETNFEEVKKEFLQLYPEHVDNIGFINVMTLFHPLYLPKELRKLIATTNAKYNREIEIIFSHIFVNLFELTKKQITISKDEFTTIIDNLFKSKNALIIDDKTNLKSADKIITNSINKDIVPSDIITALIAINSMIEKRKFTDNIRKYTECYIEHVKTKINKYKEGIFNTIYKDNIDKFINIICKDIIFALENNDINMYKHLYYKLLPYVNIDITKIDMSSAINNVKEDKLTKEQLVDFILALVNKPVNNYEKNASSKIQENVFFYKFTTSSQDISESSTKLTNYFKGLAHNKVKKTLNFLTFGKINGLNRENDLQIGQDEMRFIISLVIHNGLSEKYSNIINNGLLEIFKKYTKDFTDLNKENILKSCNYVHFRDTVLLANDMMFIDQHEGYWKEIKLYLDIIRDKLIFIIDNFYQFNMDKQIIRYIIKNFLYFLNPPNDIVNYNIHEICNNIIDDIINDLRIYDIIGTKETGIRRDFAYFIFQYENIKYRVPNNIRNFDIIKNFFDVFSSNIKNNQGQYLREDDINSVRNYENIQQLLQTISLNSNTNSNYNVNTNTNTNSTLERKKTKMLNHPIVKVIFKHLIDDNSNEFSKKYIDKTFNYDNINRDISPSNKSIYSDRIQLFINKAKIVSKEYIEKNNNNHDLSREKLVQILTNYSFLITEPIRTHVPKHEIFTLLVSLFQNLFRNLYPLHISYVDYIFWNEFSMFNKTRGLEDILPLNMRKNKSKEGYLVDNFITRVREMCNKYVEDEIDIKHNVNSNGNTKIDSITNFNKDFDEKTIYAIMNKFEYIFDEINLINLDTYEKINKYIKDILIQIVDGIEIRRKYIEKYMDYNEIKLRLPTSLNKDKKKVEKFVNDIKKVILNEIDKAEGQNKYISDERAKEIINSANIALYGGNKTRKIKKVSFNT